MVLIPRKTDLFSIGIEQIGMAQKLTDQQTGICFLGDCFTNSTMVFITIFHHHLDPFGEYVWNFFQALKSRKSKFSRDEWTTSH